MKITTRCGSAAVEELNEALLAKAHQVRVLKTEKPGSIWPIFEPICDLHRNDHGCTTSRAPDPPAGSSSRCRACGSAAGAGAIAGCALP